MALTETQRQQFWREASEEEARRGNAMSAVLFGLIAQPSETEREHSCAEHALGFSREGRRGFKCGICRQVIRWIDEEGPR